MSRSPDEKKSKQKDLGDIAPFMIRKDKKLKVDTWEEYPENAWYTSIVDTLYKGFINNFIKAREIYQAVLKSPLAFAIIYRRNDLRRRQDICAEAIVCLFPMLKDLISNKSNPSKEDIEALWKNFLEQAKKNTSKHRELAFQTVRKIYDEKAFTTLMSFIKGDPKKLEEYYEATKEQLGAMVLFNMNLEDIQECRKHHSIYTPGILHSWSGNLQWVIAHMKKSHAFHIVGNVVDNKNRFSTENPNKFSAFVREICTALKGGYELTKKGDNITLLPSAFFDPNKCISNGHKGNGVNPSDEEIKAIFVQLEEAFGSNKDFTFNLKHGIALEYNNDMKINFVEKKPDLFYALFRAANDGDIKTLKELLNNKDFDKKLLNESHHTTAGCTALHYAFVKGHNDCASLLIEAGASITVKNAKGKTPLEYYRVNNSDQIRNLERIPARSANPNRQRMPTTLAIATENYSHAVTNPLPIKISQPPKAFLLSKQATYHPKIKNATPIQQPKKQRNKKNKNKNRNKPKINDM